MRSQLNVPAPGKIETRVSATDRPRDLHVRAELSRSLYHDFGAVHQSYAITI